VAALFVALVPPPDVIDALAAAVQPLREALPELAWVAPERWHVTLCFLGPVESTAELRRRLERVARRHPAPQLQVAGGGRFGDRVLFAKVTGDLKPLATGVARAASKAGYDTDDRPFRAHLTLARGRKARADLRPPAAQLSQLINGLWRPEKLSLMRSRQPRYELVEAWPLSS
jgi:2'-5' RNA ligase